MGPEVAYYTPSEYAENLLDMGRVGKFLGGDEAAFSEIDRLEPRPVSLLDVGCGGGDFTLRVGERYPAMQVTGLDMNAAGIKLAQEKQKRLMKEHNTCKGVNFRVSAQPELKEQANSQDIVIATLMTHHLKDDVVVDLLERGKKVAARYIIINDLHRSTMAILLWRIMSWFLLARMTQYDGELSVRRSFTRDDWLKLTKAAGIPAERVQIKWKPMFRYVVIIDCAGL